MNGDELGMSVVPRQMKKKKGAGGRQRLLRLCVRAGERGRMGRWGKTEENGSSSTHILPVFRRPKPMTKLRGNADELSPLVTVSLSKRPRRPLLRHDRAGAKGRQDRIQQHQWSGPDMHLMCSPQSHHPKLRCLGNRPVPIYQRSVIPCATVDYALHAFGRPLLPPLHTTTTTAADKPPADRYIFASDTERNETIERPATANLSQGLV